MSLTPIRLDAQIATLFAALPQVEAVALGGSHGSGAGSTRMNAYPLEVEVSEVDD